MTNDTKVCPKCNKERAIREFRIWNEPVTLCRTCRARVRSRKYAEEHKRDRKHKVQKGTNWYRYLLTQNEVKPISTQAMRDDDQCKAEAEWVEAGSPASIKNGFVSTRICPACLKEQGTREFRVSDRHIRTCRACYKRYRGKFMAQEARRLMHDMYLGKEHARMQVRIKEHEERQRQKKIHEGLKWAKKEFNRATALDRSRIAKWDKLDRLSKQQQKYYALRQTELDKYTAGYARKQDAARRGEELGRLADYL